MFGIFRKKPSAHEVATQAIARAEQHVAEYEGAFTSAWETLDKIQQVLLSDALEISIKAFTVNYKNLTVWMSVSDDERLAFISKLNKVVEAASKTKDMNPFAEFTTKFTVIWLLHHHLGLHEQADRIYEAASVFQRKLYAPSNI